MAIDWGAFVKGFAGAAASQVEERSKAERDNLMEEKRLLLLEKYKIAEEERTEERKKKQVDKDLSYIDYASGQRVFTNSDGVELRREAAPASALEDRKLTLEEKRLGLDNTRSTIASRAAGDRNDAIRTANDGARTRASVESARTSQRSEDGESTGGIEGVPGRNLVSRLAVDIVRQAGVKSDDVLSQQEIMSAATRAAQTAIASGQGYDAALPLFLDTIVNKPKVQRPITRGVRGR